MIVLVEVTGSPPIYQEEIKMDTIEPKIYVACLASYNNAILHGEWIDAAQPADAIMLEIEEMLAKSPTLGAEEWAIHDYSDFGISIAEYESIEHVANIAAFIKKHDDAGLAILEHFQNLDDATRAMDEYRGVYDSEVDFARELMNECCEISDSMVIYMNYKAFAKDLFICDYFSIKRSHGMHIFRNV